MQIIGERERERGRAATIETQWYLLPGHDNKLLLTEFLMNYFCIRGSTCDCTTGDEAITTACVVLSTSLSLRSACFSCPSYSFCNHFPIQAFTCTRSLNIVPFCVVKFLISLPNRNDCLGCKCHISLREMEMELISEISQLAREISVWLPMPPKRKELQKGQK